METWMWITLLIIAVVVIAALVVYLVMQRRRSARLKDRFGPEYDRAVESKGDRREAESELRDISERREQVQITPLSPSMRRRYAADWESIQLQFVDQPREAVASADDLIVSVMGERGYPVEEFRERADMVSADHPEVAGKYRAAHRIRRQGTDATTEELREAFVHYRELFDQMLGDDAGSANGAGERTRGPGMHRGDRDDHAR